MLAKLKSVIQTKNFWLAIILLINLSLFAYFGNEKYLLFVDEGFSYGVANGSEVVMPEVSEDELCTYNPAIFRKHFTVQKEEIFNYRKITENLEDHPPLYFFIFHFINSFFLDEFNKWTGLIFNFIIFILAQLALYALSREFISVKKSFLPVIFYGFSPIAVCTALYIRNYMLLTLFLILLCLFAVRLLKALDTDDAQNYRRNLIYFCLALLGGCLTHFYFLITAFIVCAGMDAILLWRKKYKELGIFSISALGTVGLCPLLFRCFYEQLTKGTRIGQVSSTLHHNFGGYQFDIELWSEYIRRDVFGNIFSASCHWCYVAVGLAIIYLLYRLIRRQKINNSIVLLTVSLIVSVVLISAVIPPELTSIYVGNRYFFHLVPLLILLLVLFMDKVFPKFKFFFILQIALILFLLGRSWVRAAFSLYLMTDDSRNAQYAQQLKDKTLWIRWTEGEKWKKLSPALYSFYAKDFVIFKSFDDECYQNMINDENARQHSALMIENLGRDDAICETVAGFKLIYSEWASCDYLPE